MNRVKGFTLIELMIVVVIIGVLSAIAIPGYTAYVLKSHRSSAVTGVLELASRQARYYTTHNRYTTSLITLGYASDPMPLDSATSRYFDLSVQEADVDSFIIRAVPYGKQTSDVCGTFSYDDLGAMKANGATTLVKECWKK
jgi:type IV pilus assembly protein PilE